MLAGGCPGHPLPTPPDAAPAYAPPPAGSAFRLGINEALAVPARLRPRYSRAQVDAALAEDASASRRLGARVIRAHNGNFPAVSCATLARNPAGRDDLDSWVQALGTDLQGLVMLGPWPGNDTAARTDHYLPSDMAAYTACIRSLVERYDGDGVDDLPGLVQPIHHWEVDNEPDLKNSAPARTGDRSADPSTFCTPAEYAEVLIATSAAIHEADSEAVVLGLGLFRPYAERGQAYAKAVLSVPGAPSALDAISLHTYHDDDGDRLGTGIAAIRALLPDKPVWVTEASVTTAGGPEEQARRVAAYAAHAGAAGAEVLLWHSLADPPLKTGKPATQGHFSTNSLLQSIDGGPAGDKPAAAVYRNLSAKLADHDLRGATIRGGAATLTTGEVLLFRGVDVAPAGGENLRTGAEIPAGSTASAPAWLNAP